LISNEGIDLMAQRVERHPLEAAFSALLDHGLDGAGEALRILVNEASKIERTWFLVRRSKPARSRWCKSATVKD
jgi:hypothetical protein